MLTATDWSTFNAKVSPTDSRLSDARQPLPNNTNYLWNGTSQQANASFNIAGTGTLGGGLAIGGDLTVGGGALASASDRTVYVSTTGSDLSAGTQASPFATVARALAAAPTVLDHNFYIELAAGTYSFGQPTLVQGFLGRGALNIEGVSTDSAANPTVFLQNSPIYLQSVHVPVHLRHLKVTAPSGTYVSAPIYALACDVVTIESCNVQTTLGAGNWAVTISMRGVASGSITGSVVTTANQYGAAIFVLGSGLTFVDTTTVTGAGSGSEFGVEAAYGEQLYLSNSTVSSFYATVGAGIDHYGDATGGGVIVNGVTMTATSYCFVAESGGVIKDYPGNHYSCPTKSYTTPGGAVY